MFGVQQGNEHDDNVKRTGFLSRFDKMEKLMLSTFIAAIVLLIAIFTGLVILYT
jgi:cell division protein FtsL